MIAFVRGKLAELNAGSIVVEAGGLGYEIFVPATVIGSGIGIGNELMVHTYMQVKEDGVALFGFLRQDELLLFKLLITVSGIGPKGALSIMSGISADDLRFAILSGDVKTISKAPGIGAKTAGKLIFELKDKISLETAFEQKYENAGGAKEGASNSLSSSISEDAVEALTALGYSQTEALRAVRMVEPSENMTVEELLKLSLKNI